MIRTSIDNQDVRIRWRYEKVPVVLADGKNRYDERGNQVFTDLTTAIASIDGEDVGGRFIKRHYLDVFDKDKARKETLKRILHFLFPERNNKAVRRMFWNLYNNRKNISQPVSVEPSNVMTSNVG